MPQQDVFTSMGQFLIEQMQIDPVGWARTELLNSAFQDAIQRLHTEGLLTSEQREIAARLSIRVDTKELEKLRVTRHIDVLALRHLQFKFVTPQPLRVLFSGSIIHKYSTLAILLLQVKLAELMLTNVRIFACWSGAHLRETHLLRDLIAVQTGLSSPDVFRSVSE